MNSWVRLHRWRWWIRWPFKVIAFVVVVAFVLYPKIWLLPRTLDRLQNLDSTLEPGNPGLADLEAEVRTAAGEGLDARKMLPFVERVVYRHIPYAWDWDVWGVMDYLPTTAEVLEKGREDCDGRAVVAASLLRRMGYKAWLASDLKHTWVVTPAGETMSPGKGRKSIAGGPKGTRFQIDWGMVANVGRSMTYGVAVFPLTRELLILGALCGLTMHPRSGTRRRVAGCLVLLLALGLMRDSGAVGSGLAAHPAWLWVGLVLGVAGWLLLAIRGEGRRSSSGPSESCEAGA
ncbi:MAG: hypothetical protein PVJ57_02470 [Phycisphaerae bacterium]|jgi:hypothetical protein